MKKIKFRLLTMALLFAAALSVWFWLSFRRSGEVQPESSAVMEESTFPLIWTESCGRRMNVMRGYAESSDADIAADTLILLPEDRELSLCAEGGSLRLYSLGYEIRSADLKNLIERTELTEWQETEDGIQAVLPIQNLLHSGEEYRLELILTVEGNKEIHYYARIAFDTTGMAAEMLQLAEDFSVRNFNYDAARENTTYLESGVEGDNTTLGRVNLKSSFGQLTYGRLKLTPTGEADLRLLEYNGSMGVIRRSLTASGDGADGAQMQFDISETFVMRKGPERLYLMDYTRTMHEVFLGDRDSFSESGIRLGIGEGEELCSIASGNQKFRAFSSAGDLWLADGTDNSCVRVWSFRSGMDAGLRSGYAKHSVKPLALSDSGELVFLVSGYMNRGRREGQVGLSLMRYDVTSNIVTEQSFLPAETTAEELMADVETLSYLSGRGMFYFKLGSAFYGLDMRSNEYLVVCDGLREGTAAVSDDQSELAWQDENDSFGSVALYLMNLESGAKQELRFGEDRRLKPIGYIGRDLAVGIAEQENVWTLNGIDRELPFSAIEIVDDALNSEKHYGEAGIFLSDAYAEDGRIHLTRLRKTGEHSFQSVENDTIVCNTQSAGEATLPAEMTELREKSYCTALPEGFVPARLKTVRPAAIHYESSAELRLSGGGKRSGAYSAYGQGKYLGSFERLGEAANAAHSRMGIVRSRGKLVYCRAGTASVRTLRNAEAEADAAMEARRDGTAVDLYGANLRVVFYYLSQGIPVLGWSDGGVPLLISAYDQSAVSLYNAADGSWIRLGIPEVRQMFENGRNDFSFRMSVN